MHLSVSENVWGTPPTEKRAHRMHGIDCERRIVPIRLPKGQSSLGVRKDRPRFYSRATWRRSASSSESVLPSAVHVYCGGLRLLHFQSLSASEWSRCAPRWGSGSDQTISSGRSKSKELLHSKKQCGELVIFIDRLENLSDGEKNNRTESLRIDFVELRKQRCLIQFFPNVKKITTSERRNIERS